LVASHSTGDILRILHSVMMTQMDQKINGKPASNYVSLNDMIATFASGKWEAQWTALEIAKETVWGSKNSRDLSNAMELYHMLLRDPIFAERMEMLLLCGAKSPEQGESFSAFLQRMWHFTCMPEGTWYHTLLGSQGRTISVSGNMPLENVNADIMEIARSEAKAARCNDMQPTKRARRGGARRKTRRIHYKRAR